MNSSTSSVSTSRSIESMSAKRLNSDRLAFHHRLGGERAEIAEAQNGGAVGDDRDHVALDGVVVGERGIVGDRLHRHGDAGRIGERQVALRRHRLGGDDLELAGPPARMELQRLLVGDRRAFGRGVEIVGHEKSSSRVREPRRARREGAKSSTRASVCISPMTSRWRRARRRRRNGGRPHIGASSSARLARPSFVPAVALRLVLKHGVRLATRRWRYRGQWGGSRRADHCRRDRWSRPARRPAPPRVRGGPTSAASGRADKTSGIRRLASNPSCNYIKICLCGYIGS